MIIENPKELVLQSTLLNSELKNIATKVFNSERITFDEGVYLFEHASLSYLGTLANYVREKKNQNFVFFMAAHLRVASIALEAENLQDDVLEGISHSSAAPHFEKNSIKKRRLVN